MQWVPVERIHLSPARPRGSLPELAPSLLAAVEEYGAVQPVAVRPLGDGRFELLAGAQTWLAVQRLGRARVPVVVRDDVNAHEAADLARAYATTDQLDPISQAQIYERRLEDFGGAGQRGAVTRLARYLEIERSRVAHALRLLKLPKEVRTLVSSGQLSAGHGRALAGVGNRRRCLTLARRALREGLSVRATEALVVGSGPQPIAAPDPDLLRLERRLSESLGCRVTLDMQRGTLSIDYAGDLDVLDGILDRLGYSDS